MCVLFQMLLRCVTLLILLDARENNFKYVFYLENKRNKRKYLPQRIGILIRTY